MTTWHERFQPASFRGVPFHVETSERSGGRRVVRHEYPLRDEPFVEDMGRRPRGFTVDAYILGADYFAARDALIDELEASGPGELVHPYYGRRRVVVDGEFNLRETSREGGICRFTIPFVETPAKPIQPSAVPDGPARVAASTANARVAVSRDFLSRYSPGILLGSVTATLQSLTVKINSVVQTAQADSQQLATIKKQALDFSNSIASLIKAPGNLVDDLVDIFGSFNSDLLRLYAFRPDTRPPSTTPNRVIEQKNYDATLALIGQLLVIRAAEVAPAQVYDNYEAAVTARDAITVLIDEQRDSAPDASFAALTRLRADLVTAVPGQDSDLAHLVSYTPTQTLPSLVLAHQLYGDVTREPDIVARNRIQHPGFVVGGRALEILSA